MQYDTVMDKQSDDKTDVSTTYEKKVHSVKNYKTYYARHYFPPPKKSTSYQNILYTASGISYMTSRIDAELTTGIIIRYCNEQNINYSDIIITDATAGLGGNTFSFAKLFKHVNAIEKDIEPFKILENNLKEYEYSNVTLINADYMNVYQHFRQHVIFIDPPWGGKNYMKFEKLRLKLSEFDIEYVCNILRNNIIVLKLPINYDFENFLSTLCMLHVTSVKMNDSRVHNFLLSLNTPYSTTEQTERNEIVRCEYDIANIHIHRLKKMYIVIIVPN